MTWHAPPDALVQFAQSPEDVDDVLAASIEQHLVACAGCRAAVASATDTVSLGRSWAEVADAIDQPTRTVIERLLHRLGVPAHQAQLVGATPQLRFAWLATTILLAAAAVAAARDMGSDTPFLLVAPMVPLGAVLVTFLPTEEPGGEAAIATALHGAGLLLRRAIAVLVPTFAILGLASLAQPEVSRSSALWVLPGLALALGALALSTMVRASTAVAVLAMSWIGLVTLVGFVDVRAHSVADTALFTTSGQLGAVGIAVIAAGWLYARRDAFSTMEVTW